MTLSRENRIWFFAVSISVFFHALFFMFAVNFQQKKRETPIIVKLIEEKAATENTVVAERQSKKKASAKKNYAVPQDEYKTIQKTKSGTRSNTQQVVDNKGQKQTTDKDEQKIESENIGNRRTGSAGENAGSSTGYSVSGKQGTDNIAGEVVDIHALVIMKKITPQYPSFSRKRKEEGTVYLLITISENSVSECKIEKSSGYARLDEAARRAVVQWKFSHNGNVRARVPVVFKISD